MTDQGDVLVSIDVLSAALHPVARVSLSGIRAAVAALIAERDAQTDTIDDLKADIDKLTDANTEALEHMAEIRAERDALFHHQQSGERNE